jgi:CheY-like chemotaxis protein
MALEYVKENIQNIQKYYSKYQQNLISFQKKPSHFDAIILDLNMPIMNGYDACKFILDSYSRYNYNKLIYGDLENLELQN